jgi:asparagine synthase (glutamine-hydrolysing)
MRSLARTSVELGLVGVTATQLWHHLYIDGSLCELPTVSGSGGGAGYTGRRTLRR